MSGKGAHVQDSSVLERRLRPIYDWLDSGNYKKAIQECDKVLKKSPNLDRARALKALSLLRLGKEGECVSILDSLTAQTPSDDAILQAMTMCYRELQQLDKICRLYETAVKIEPTNEELHTHLFMSYVRTFDFKQQQQSAMTLYKLAPKNPYYCWAVMSVILQATRGDGASDPKRRTLLLSLAERMIDKLIQDNKLEAEQEVQLYVIVLDEQKKYEKVLEVLDGPFGSKLSGESILNKLPYLVKLNKWNIINTLCKKSLSESMDRWDIWKHYLRSVFELKSPQNGSINHTNHQENNDESELESVDDTAEKAHEFICKLVESGNGFALRGPYLARFELCKQLKQQKGDIECVFELLGDVMELFMEYFKKFGHKPCCVSDLRSYVDLLDGEKQLELAGKLIRDVGISSTSVPQSEQQMRRHICALQLSRLCGSHLNLSAEHVKALVTAFSYHYLHGHQTYGQNLLSTDQAPADAYTLLVAHLLYDLHRKLQSSQPLLLALVLLGNTLRNSPSNFHIKLLALKIYHVLGAGAGEQSLYESLDIKHLQLDSLCYIHCGRLSTTGHYTYAASLFDTTLKFFSTNYKDSSDHLTFSYKFGSFLKLTEFMDFRERMNNSFNYTCTAVDRLFLSFVQCNSIDQVYALETSPRDDPVAWDLIRNNNDLGLHVSWDPERVGSAIEEWPESVDLHEQDIAYLKLRVALLDCMQACIQIIKTPTEMMKNVARLEMELKNWGIVAEKVTLANYQTIEQRLLCMSLPSRLSIYLEVPYMAILEPMFKVVIAVTSEDGDMCETTSTTVITLYKAMIITICDLLAEETEMVDVYMYRRRILEYLCNVIEVFSIVCILCALCLEVIKSSQSNKKVKKKAFDGKTRENLTNLVTSIKTESLRLDESLKSSLECTSDKHKSSYITNELMEKLKTLNLSDNNEVNVIKTLQKTHESGIKEIRAVLKSKLRLLQTS